MSNVSVNIDGIDISVKEGTTILEAAREAKINVPTLCYYPDQKIKGNCRVCIVEVEGQRTFSSACSTPVRNGMRIKTNTKKVRDARKLIVEMILAGHNVNCPECEKDGNCELQNLCKELNIKETNLKKFVPPPVENESDAPVIRDESKCIKCGRCVETCNEVQGVGAIYTVGRSCDMQITPAYGRSLDMVKCVYCGQCINVCPVGAIYERDDTDKVWEALEDKDKHVVVQMAPAVRVALGEEFGMEPGSIVTGKIVSFLRRIGFAKVFDTNFTADLTIMEEGNELLYRLKNNGKLPMFTSCSPGWIRFVEFFYPEFMENLS
ncbi:MAG: 4Fe-4S binding protein, partial [Candidatus Afipia apatlaquensis]|nr:4Fe-4S binding protein [Candidatus Afipia apatlaquensis]